VAIAMNEYGQAQQRLGDRARRLGLEWEERERPREKDTPVDQRDSDDDEEKGKIDGSSGDEKGGDNGQMSPQSPQSSPRTKEKIKDKDYEALDDDELDSVSEREDDLCAHMHS